MDRWTDVSGGGSGPRVAYAERYGAGRLRTRVSRGAERTIRGDQRSTWRAWRNALIG